jgi:hypothetical protein
MRAHTHRKTARSQKICRFSLLTASKNKKKLRVLVLVLVREYKRSIFVGRLGIMKLKYQKEDNGGRTKTIRITKYIKGGEGETI